MVGRLVADGFVVLNAAKDLYLGEVQVLRCVQDDKNEERA
jgi:hypothetical protein